MKIRKQLVKYGSRLAVGSAALLSSMSVLALDTTAFTTAMTAGEADIALVIGAVLNFVVLLFVLSKVRQIGKA